MNSDKYERQCLKPRKDDLFLMTFIVSCAVISNHNNGVGKVLVIYPPYRFSVWVSVSLASALSSEEEFNSDFNQLSDKRTKTNMTTKTYL